MNADFKKGVFGNLPLVLSVVSYGSVLGILSAQKQLGILEVLGMNILMFAGSAQFVMVEMWRVPLPILEMIFSVFAINLRYLLIGASLKPIFAGTNLLKKMLYMHLVADENWALTMAEYHKKGATYMYLFGGGLCILLAWCVGTMAGLQVGGFISNPEKFALDFAFVAVFTSLVMSLWKGKADIIPWLVAIGLAILTHRFLPGKWYIIVGGIGGATIPAILKPERGEDSDDI